MLRTDRCCRINPDKKRRKVNSPITEEETKTEIVEDVRRTIVNRGILDSLPRQAGSRVTSKRDGKASES
jgi:hypothetical protein